MSVPKPPQAVLTPQGDTELVDEWSVRELVDHIWRGEPCAYGEVVRVLTARIAATASAGALTTPREAAHDLSRALASIAVVVDRIVVDILDDMAPDDPCREEIENQAAEIDRSARALRGIAEGWI